MYKCCQNQTSDHKSQQRKHPFFIILFLKKSHCFVCRLHLHPISFGSINCPIFYRIFFRLTIFHFFTFQRISHLSIFQTFYLICLWKKVKSQAMPHSQPFGLFHGRLAPYKTAKINAPASKLAERYFYCFAWLVA